MTAEHVRETAPHSFRLYAAYKDSGVEWLGNIPAHWEVKRLWHLTPSDRRIMYGIVLPGPNVDDGVPIVKGGDVSPERLRLERLNRTTREIESGYVRSRLRGGDLVYAIRGSIGEVAIVPDELQGANLTQDAARIAYTAATYGPWLLHALKSAAVFAQLEAGALGATIRGVNIRDLKRASIPVPPRVEQRAIATFLERETTRIDALAAKKERLIELLQEKRAALITRAVTKGLDPTVPMKDSGVEWLGEIPAHWDLVRVGRVAAIGNGSTPRRENQEYWSSGEHPWLTSGKINDEIISAVDEFVTDAAILECHLPRVSAGSVLVAITGEGQTRGRAALLQVPSTISQHLAFITPRNGRLAPEYLWRVLQSQYHWLRSESGGAGSTRAALTCEYLTSIKVPLPPRAEQRDIAELIGTTDGRFLALVQGVSHAIDRLRELRAALISAAVTGKIDVRGLS